MSNVRPQHVCPIQKRYCSIGGRETTHVLHLKGDDTWRCMEEAAHAYNRTAVDKGPKEEYSCSADLESSGLGSSQLTTMVK